MNRKIRTLSTLLLGVGILSACQQGVEQAAPAQQGSATQPKVVDLVPAVQPAPTPSMANGLATGKVVEVIDAAGYTYIRVDVGGQELWAAGPPTPMAAGDTVSFSTMIPMKNFHSKSMNRDFETLYFVDAFSTTGSAGGSAASGGAHATTAVSAAATKPVVEKIEKVAGGYTIAEALAQRKELAGKPIKVRGKVTKYTPGIMRKNWIHIEDGSSDKDLIVTTTATATTGSIITAEGALSLDRDFGMGYFYEVLMEDARITAE